MDPSGDWTYDDGFADGSTAANHHKGMLTEDRHVVGHEKRSTLNVSSPSC